MDRRTAAALIGLSLLSGCAWNQALPPMAPIRPSAEPASLSDAAANPVAGESEPAAPGSPRTASRPSFPPIPDRSLPAPRQPPAQIAAEPSPNSSAPPSVAEAEAPPVQAPAPAEDVKTDASIQRAGLETESSPRLSEDPGEPTTVVVARVGDTVITTTEFAYGVRSRVRGSDYAQMPPQQKVQLQKDTLEYLIDRAMLVQESRRRLKNPKQWEAFKSAIEKEWIDKELPAMLAREKINNPDVNNEYELEKSLADHHQSLDEIRENYMLDHIGRYYMMTMIQDKFLTPNLNDIYAYYDQNKGRPEFQQTAHVTWRLIFIPVDETLDQASARKAASAAHGRLQRGEDFGSVCKQVSKGPRASDGGLWSTGYESYASNIVNEALKTLPLNKLSPILEDGRGFYIVRVEGRREAGAKPFSEVQKSISEALVEERFHVAMERFLADLRRNVPVSCPVFEGTPLEPKQVHPQ